MIKRVFISEHGEVTGIIVGGGIEVQLNTPLDSLFNDLSSETQVNIGDYFKDGKLVHLKEKPSDYAEFNYELKQWIDSRTLDQLKDQKWVEIKKDRNSLEFGGFVFNDDIYDSDPLSQSRIINAANAGLSQIWTLADNTTQTLNPEQLKSLNHALQTHIASTHEKGRIARKKIFDAISIDELTQIKL